MPLHLSRFTEALPSGWVFIVVCALLRSIEGTGTAMFLTALFSLLPQLYPNHMGIMTVRTHCVKSELRRNSRRLHRSLHLNSNHDFKAKPPPCILAILCQHFCFEAGMNEGMNEALTLCVNVHSSPTSWDSIQYNIMAALYLIRGCPPLYFISISSFLFPHFHSHFPNSRSNHCIASSGIILCM